MEERPGLTLGDAVKLATYDKVREASQIQQNRTAQAQQKTRSFVESSKTSRSGDIDYSKLSLEELEAILPKSGQFIDSKGVLQQ
jgi:hypothetical protein